LGEAGEVLDLAGLGFLVEAFGVALEADLQGTVDEDFEECTCGEEVTGELTVSPEGGDEGGDEDKAGVVEELGEVGDTADVFLAAGGGEVEIGVEAGADVVAIEEVGVGGEFAVEAFFEGVGDGGFAGAGEAGEPDDERGVVFDSSAPGLGEFVGVGGEIRHDPIKPSPNPSQQVGGG